MIRYSNFDCYIYDGRILTSNTPNYYTYVNTHISDLKPEDALLLTNSVRYKSSVRDDRYFLFGVPSRSLKDYFPNLWTCDNGYRWSNSNHFKKVSCILPDREVTRCELHIVNDSCMEFVSPGVYKFEPELHGYHSLQPQWRSDPNNKEKCVLGVELEVMAKSREDRKKLRNYIYSLTNEEAIIESDSSLDGSCGAEIIFRPQTQKELLGDKFKTILSNIRHHCDNSVQPANYGMHLNVSAGWFDKSLLHKMKFIHQINEADNLTETVAQRRSNTYAGIHKTTLKQRKYPTPKFGAVNTSRMNERLEVRIFRSVLDWTGFSRQVDYTLSVIEYTKQASMRALNEQDYLSWLKQYPSRYKLIKSGVA